MVRTTSADAAGSDAEAGAAFNWPVRVYFEDTDAGGVVYYANYLKFFERCRTEWLRALGIDQSTLAREQGIQFVVAAIDAKYLQPARLDDELAIVARVLQLGRCSIVFDRPARLDVRISLAGSCSPPPMPTPKRSIRTFGISHRVRVRRYPRIRCYCSRSMWIRRCRPSTGGC